MGKKNVVLWDGSVATVSDEDAAQLEQSGQYGRREDTSEANARGARDALESSTDAVDKGRAVAEGFADTITGGGYGKIVEGLGSLEDVYGMQRAGTVAPGYRLGGEMLGYLLPTGEVSAVGSAAKLGERVAGHTGSKLIGRFIEGGILGAEGHIAHTNVSGDQLTVEGLVEGAGVGGVLNVGAGALGDKLTGAGNRAREAVEEAEKLAQQAEIAKTNAAHFESDAGVNTAWKQFRTSVNVRQKAVEKAAREWESRSDLYQSFFGNNQRVGRAIEDAENVVRSVRARYSPHAPATPAPADAGGFDVSDVEAEMGTAGSPTKGVGVEFRDGQWRAKHYVTNPKTGEVTENLHTSKPPISPEMDARLKEYQARVSRLYQMKGGRLNINPQKWGGPSGPVNQEALAGELRSLYEDLGREFPKASGKLKPVPAPLPPRPPQLPSFELAGSFRAFVRQHPETVAKLANSMDDATAGEFGRVVNELGISPGATPQETVTAVHRQAGEWLRAVDDLKAAAEKEGRDVASGKGFFALIRRFARNSARFKSGFEVAHMIGGPIGSAAGVAASAAVGGVLERLDDALVNGTLMTSKSGIRDRISNVVSEWGAPVGKKVTQLGPVMSWLGSAHLTDGHRDEESDVRRQARNRIDEIHGAAMAAPDTAFAAVEPLLGHPSDVAWKVHNLVMTAVNHLQAMVPRDPGLDIKMFRSNWTPAWHEAVQLAHRLEAVHAPLTSLARLMSGAGNDAAAETLWTVYPAIMQEAAAQIVERATNGEYDTRRASAFSRVFRVPLTGFQNPVVVTALQGAYLPQPGSPSSSGGNSQPTGRPPSVQSPVAGSSVAALIS